MYFLVYKVDSSVNNTHSTLRSSFISVDSAFSVLDFYYFVPFLCIKYSEVNLFMIFHYCSAVESSDANSMVSSTISTFKGKRKAPSNVMEGE